MDNLSLEVLVNELRTRILDASIQRIRLIAERTFVLALRSRATEYLILTLQPGLPGLCVLTEDIRAEASPSDGLLALRKYLIGGRISAVRKSLADRVVYLEIENSRLSQQPERFALAVELIPNRVRACLLDADQQILVWLTSLSAPFGRYAAPVIPPCRLDSIDEETFCSLFERGRDVSALSPIFGLSSLFAREVLLHGKLDSQKAWEALQTLVQRVSNGPHSPRIYHMEQKSRSPGEDSHPNGHAKQVIAPFALDCLGSTEFQTFSSMNALAAELFRHSLEKRARLKSVQSGYNKVAAEIRRKQRLKAKLQVQLKEAAEAQSLRVYADLLYAQYEKSVRGHTVRVPNLFDPDLRELDIPLLPELSLIENANRYHRLYRKAARSIAQVTNRLRLLESEITELQQEEERLVKRQTEPRLPDPAFAEIDGSRADRTKRPAVSEHRPSSHSRPDAVSLVRRAAKVFVSSEGMQILVGKSNKDNDVLTLKIARREDFWLHVAGYGGSHVVLRNPEKLTSPPKQSLLEAAQLAAYFSQARNAPKVEVHYTQKKSVSKPKGAKAGLVQLKEYKSISARPQLLAQISTGKTRSHQANDR